MLLASQKDCKIKFFYSVLEFDRFGLDKKNSTEIDFTDLECFTAPVNIDINN
jgi:hypothetical protein